MTDRINEMYKLQIASNDIYSGKRYVLKDGQKSAVTKRKKAPVKSVKATKSVNKNAKAKEKADNLRKKVLQGGASENQQDEFLGSMVDNILK